MDQEAIVNALVNQFRAVRAAQEFQLRLRLRAVTREWDRSWRTILGRGVGANGKPVPRGTADGAVEYSGPPAE